LPARADAQAAECRLMLWLRSFRAGVPALHEIMSGDRQFRRKRVWRQCPYIIFHRDMAWVPKLPPTPRPAARQPHARRAALQGAQWRAAWYRLHLLSCALPAGKRRLCAEGVLTGSAP